MSISFPAFSRLIRHFTFIGRLRYPCNVFHIIPITYARYLMLVLTFLRVRSESRRYAAPAGTGEAIASSKGYPRGVGCQSPCLRTRIRRFKQDYFYPPVQSPVLRRVILGNWLIFGIARCRNPLGWERVFLY